jgi:hypothetical protein
MYFAYSMSSAKISAMQSAATATPKLAMKTRTGRLNSSSTLVRMIGSVRVRTTEKPSTVLS